MTIDGIETDRAVTTWAPGRPETCPVANRRRERLERAGLGAIGDFHFAWVLDGRLELNEHFERNRTIEEGDRILDQAA